MARKQKAKGFNRFLDLIGLVDTDNGREDDFDADFDTSRVRGRSGSKSAQNLNDDFSDEPRMARAQSRRDRTSASNQAPSGSNSRFDAEEGWGEASARPEYSSRTQQRTQNSARSSRYGSEQRYGTGSHAQRSSRYEAPSTNEDSYYRSGSYESSYRSGAQYGSYGSSSRRADESAYSAASVPERSSQQYGAAGNQRHQTVIFKLHSVDECRGVILALIDKKSVLLNLDELDSLQAQRTLDTMSGATFAIGATLSRASDRTWLITPSTVDVADSQVDTSASYGGRYM